MRPYPSSPRRRISSQNSGRVPFRSAPASDPYVGFAFDDAVEGFVNLALNAVVLAGVPIEGDRHFRSGRRFERGHDSSPQIHEPTEWCPLTQQIYSEEALRVKY